MGGLDRQARFQEILLCPENPRARLQLVNYRKAVQQY